MFVLGTTLNLVLFGRTETGTTFVKATGFLLTMMLLWFGVGNILAVARPLRAVPLADRRHDGTLIPFLFSFAVAYGLGYLVNLMLYWRVWTKETLLERFGSPWLPTLLIVGSALLSYVLFTVAGGHAGRTAPVPPAVDPGDDRLPGSEGGGRRHRACRQSRGDERR